MAALTLKLHWKEIEKIKELLKYEEARVVRRANILNCLHLGYTSGIISQILNVDPKTVTNVGHAYLDNGLDGALFDEERCGRPIDIDDKERSRIVAMVCSDPPDGNYRWTLDLIVEQAIERGLLEGSISREQVRIILQEHDLKPWQEKMWCIPELDEEYIERMEDILDLYEKKYNESCPVVCVDEKPVPLISDIRERIHPVNEGEVLKIDYEYKRGGSVNVFCGVEPLVGRYFNEVTDQRCGSDFAKFLKKISEEYPKAKIISLVMDNISTHKLKSITDLFGEEEGNKLWNRFDIHYTPKHASWLNQDEIAIGIYYRQCIGDGRVGTIEKLKMKTNAWNTRANTKKTTIQWRFNKIKARKSLNYTPKLILSAPEKLI